MSTQRSYQVKEVARLAGVTVRTLHHYDEIGLLVPSGRSASGYRRYSERDLLRLQQILLGREMGLSLEEIRRSIDDPNFDLEAALRAQRALLQQRATRTAELIRAIDQALARLRGTPGDTMNHGDLFEGFNPSEYEEEARQRWGNTDAYQESARRTSAYTQEDWARLKEEQKAIYDEAAAAMKAGKRPDEDAVMAIAERHRQSIDRWFYPCSLAMHGALADMYEADPRFAANIDRHGEGLTPFLSAAIRANARRPGG